MKTESYCAGWNLDAAVNYGRVNSGYWISLPIFLIERQLMQHVGQRLRVHQPMFDSYVEKSVQSEAIAHREMRVGNGVEFIVEGCADFSYIAADFFDGWP